MFMFPRRILTVLLVFGVVAGFGSGFAAIARHHRGGGCSAWQHGGYGQYGQEERGDTKAPVAAPQPASAPQTVIVQAPAPAAAPAPVIVVVPVNGQPYLSPAPAPVAAPAVAPVAPAAVTP